MKKLFVLIFCLLGLTTFAQKAVSTTADGVPCRDCAAERAKNEKNRNAQGANWYKQKSDAPKTAQRHQEELNKQNAEKNKPKPKESHYVINPPQSPAKSSANTPKKK